MHKLIKLLLLVVVTGFSLSQLKAATTKPDPSTEPGPKEAEKPTRSYFKFPQILLPVKEKQKVELNEVEVVFSTDKNCKVIFVMAKTENQELKKEIEKQFLELQVNHLPSDVLHKVVLHFRTI